MSYGSFYSQKEAKAYKAFVKKHAKCGVKFKINNGANPYVITVGCGVGVGYTVVCPICGERQDITDVASW